MVFPLRQASRSKIIQFYETTGLQGWRTLTISSCQLHQALLKQVTGPESILTVAPFSQLHKADTGEGLKHKKTRKWAKEARWEMGMARPACVFHASTDLYQRTQ